MIHTLINAGKNSPLNTTVFYVIIAYLISWLFGVSAFYTSSYFFIFLGMLANNFVYNNRELLDKSKE